MLVAKSVYLMQLLGVKQSRHFMPFYRSNLLSQLSTASSRINCYLAIEAIRRYQAKMDISRAISFECSVLIIYKLTVEGIRE